MRLLITALMLVMGFATVQAATPTLSGAGATNVDVNGTLYDVSFTNGSCISLFTGCDEISDFTFQDQTAADAAKVSLRLLFAETPSLLEDPSLIEGCEPFRDAICQVIIAYPAAAPNFSLTGVMIEADFIFSGFDLRAGLLGNFQQPTSFNTVGNPTATFARFTVSEVPLPAGGWLLLSGVFALTAFRRRNEPAA